MAHHSSDGPLGGEPEQLKKLLETTALQEAKQAMFGPTERRPEPRLGPNDEGELRFGVTVMKDEAGQKKVVIDFGTPVHSIGMTKEQALEMGRLLITRAGYTCRIAID